MKYEWVIGLFTGERAKSVRAHADVGLGYFVRQESGRGADYSVEAAFRRVCDTPLPEHLERATAQQAERLDALYQQRTS